MINTRAGAHLRNLTRPPSIAISTTTAIPRAVATTRCWAGMATTFCSGRAGMISYGAAPGTTGSSGAAVTTHWTAAPVRTKLGRETITRKNLGK